MKEEMKEYKALRKYEEELRTEVEKILGFKIPIVPQNINPYVEILFLERLLHINGFGEVEKKFYVKAWTK